MRYESPICLISRPLPRSSYDARSESTTDATSSTDPPNAPPTSFARTGPRVAKSLAWQRAQRFVVRGRLRRETLVADVEQRREMLAGRPERLHLKQPRDEEVALELLFLVDLLRLRTRQEGLRLEREERRRHDEELRRDLEIHALQPLDVSEVVLAQARDGDVADVDALLGDQCEQQLERPFEDVQLHFIRTHLIGLACGSFTTSRTASMVSVTMGRIF